MFQSIISRLLRRRHFWRYASFSEIAELYASRVMRLLALRMISLFIALYLYQNGLDLMFIAMYFMIYFIAKVFIAYFAAKFAAKFGPKHGILLGNLLYIPALVAFTFVPEYGIYAVALFGLFQAWSVTIYDLCYLVDFSKVKHSDHAGKELGFMQIFEKITTALSPLIGGAVAFIFGVEATLWLSAIIFAFASWPLMRSAEQTKTGQKLSFNGFPWRATWRSMVAESAIGFDLVASTTVWILFIALTIFAGSGDDLYLKIGALTSVTFMTSFIAAFVFGRLIDRRRGKDLLIVSTVVNSMTHLLRSFITTPVGVATTNVASETSTTGYSMAFTRGMFDSADRSGNRIAYLLCIEVALNLGGMLACAIFAICLYLFPASNTISMQVFFGVAAAYTLLIGVANFTLYRK